MMRAAYLTLMEAKGTPIWPTAAGRPPVSSDNDSLDFIAVATLMSAVRTLQTTVASLEQRIAALESK